MLRESRARRRYLSHMQWTTFFFANGREHSLAGIVLDSASLGGHDPAHERTNRVQITASSEDALPESSATQRDMSSLVEFLDVAARTLAACTTNSGRWSALIVSVRQESGLLTAFLVDDADNFARSGAQVVLTLASVEIAASEMPWADEDPEGFERANQILKERMRSALAHAAMTEPARGSMQRLRDEKGIMLLLDLVGEVDSADFEPLHAA
jgi:hypothetical protein